MKRELKEETLPFFSEKIPEHDGIGYYQAANVAAESLS